MRLIIVINHLSTLRQTTERLTSMHACYVTGVAISGADDSAAEGECRKEVIMDLVFRVLRGDLVEGPRGKSLVVSPKGSRSVGH